ncbi:MAG: NAD(P)H-hydrate dehydratase [Chitinimonas sp.]|nr:NAD(P)H-hydrate dehydratase [Chitinimonas sp.]
MFHTVSQLRQIEQQASKQGLPLMQRAGRAAADFISRRFGKAAPIGVLVGPGNNGGDALVAATLLKQLGYSLSVCMPAGPGSLPADAATAYRDWQRCGGTESAQAPTGACTVIIDGLFGLGLNRPLAPHWQALITQVNQLGKPILALDVPSGVHADSGALLGAPIQARWTLSFIGQARGLATGAARDYTGLCLLDKLGLVAPTLDQAALPDTATVAQTIRIPRAADSHKGSYGTICIIGGAEGMTGAALLAGRAALQAGAGKVFTGLLGPVPSADLARPELMLRPADTLLMDAADLILLGPGLGQGAPAADLLHHALSSQQALVLDADALNLLASDPRLTQAARLRQAPTVLTPHPAEAARLLACSTAEVQQHRYDAAAELARRYHATIVLKGAGSVIVDGALMAVNQSGSAALANAGQGDLLSGLIAALMAQGLTAWQATCLATHLHGCASDALVNRDGRGITLANEVIAELDRHLAPYFR